MPVPRWVATVNRQVTNHITSAAATLLPGFGVITHPGRRSGRLYRTPVNVFTVADGYVVALTYGAESDWVKNVLAAGGCELEHRGRREHLGAPRLVHDQTRRQVPALLRSVLGVLHVADFMTLHPEDAPEPAGNDRRA